MEKTDSLDRWVRLRMTAADPPAEWPDYEAARRCFDRRRAARPRRLLTAACAAAVVVAGVVGFTASRGLAQRLWDELVLGRVQVLMLDLDGDGAAASFVVPEIQRRPEVRPVASLEEAARVAGFSPRVPAAGTFTSPPRYSVADVTSAVLRLRTPAMRYLMANAGGFAGNIPASWDGVALEFRAGPLVVADYDGVLLLQGLPVRMTTPADFDLDLFYRVAFRALGIGEHLATDLRVSPALLMVMPKEERDLVHEFATRSGAGVMIEEVYGPGKILAIWSAPDRLYALFPESGEISREFIARVATALE